MKGLKKIAQFLKINQKILGSLGFDAHPLVVEFVLHYLGGSQTPKTLPAELMELSRRRVQAALRGGQKIGGEESNLYWADLYERKYVFWK